MTEVAELTLGVLTRLADAPLDVVVTTAALRDCVSPTWADEVLVWVPSADSSRLTLVPTTRGDLRVAVPDDVPDAIRALLDDGRRGRLHTPELRSLTSAVGGAGGLEDQWTSAVFAPLTLTGAAQGACLYTRRDPRPSFTDHEGDVLLALTRQCSGLILTSALGEQSLLDRDLVQSLPEAVIAVDPEFRVIRWNLAAERLYGIPAEAAIDSPRSTLYSTYFDDPGMDTDTAWEQLLRTGHWRGYVTQQTKSGRTLSVFASTTTVRDADGRLVAAVAVNRETTPIVAARSRAKLAQPALAEALDAAGSMTVVLDPDGTILAANREWLDVGLATGARMDLVSVGANYLRPVRRAVAAGDPTAGTALAALESVLDGSRSVAGADYRCDRPDGAHWYRMDVRRLDGSDATIVSHREAEVEHGHVHDSLTGLGDRQWLEQRVARSLAGRATDDAEFGLIVCDIDDFAAFNDTFGHAAGDEILRTVAQRLRRQCPPTMVTVHLGADRFAVVAESMWGAMPLVDVAEHLRSAVAEPIDVDGRPLVLSLSTGIATMLPLGGRSAADLISELIGQAEAARVTSQSPAGDTAQGYRSVPRYRTTSLLTMREDFAAAIRSGTLEMRYQQIRRVADDEVSGFEALVRWPRPGSPLLTPETFGVLLDDPAIAGPLADWSIGAVAEAAQILRARHPGKALTVAVNVSAQQLRDLDVASRLAGAARSAQVPPSALVVEFTQTTASLADPQVLGRLAAIHDVGVTIAHADFAARFTSVAQQRDLPADVVKIDRRFTRGLGTDPVPEALVRALIAIAHDLGLVVVAEGVEHAAQRDWLVAAGCDLYQGFLAHRPAPIAEVLDLSVD